MIETRYNAAAELRDPARFIALAKQDLRIAGGAAWQLFLCNVQVRYRHTGIGYIWLLLPTIGTTVVWVYMHARRIIVVTPPDIPYPVHVLAGMTLWQTFADALNAPLQQLRAGRYLITRTRVPHEALILAGAFEAVLNCVARLVVLAALLAAYGVSPAASMLLMPFGIAALALLGLALGVLIVPLGLLYGGVDRAVGLASGFWFFLTPVIYPAPDIGILRLNPVTPLLETTRAWLTSAPVTTGGFVAVSTVALVLLGIAWLLLRLARPHVVGALV